MTHKKDEDIDDDREIVTKDMIEEARSDLLSAQSLYESCIAARKTAVVEIDKARQTLGALEGLLQQTIFLESEAKKRVLQFKDRHIALIEARAKRLDS